MIATKSKFEDTYNTMTEKITGGMNTNPAQMQTIAEAIMPLLDSMDIGDMLTMETKDTLREREEWRFIKRGDSEYKVERADGVYTGTTGSGFSKKTYNMGEWNVSKVDTTIKDNAGGICIAIYRSGDFSTHCFWALDNKYRR